MHDGTGASNSRIGCRACSVTALAGVGECHLVFLKIGADCAGWVKHELLGWFGTISPFWQATALILNSFINHLKIQLVNSQ